MEPCALVYTPWECLVWVIIGLETYSAQSQTVYSKAVWSVTLLFTYLPFAIISARNAPSLSRLLACTYSGSMFLICLVIFYSLTHLNSESPLYLCEKALFNLTLFSVSIATSIPASSCPPNLWVTFNSSWCHMQIKTFFFPTVLFF